MRKRSTTRSHVSHDRSEAELTASWDANADAWTLAVREGAIPSRRAGTDAAIMHACLRAPLGRVLDVGCGEGWLARALARRGASVLGVDGSSDLIVEARRAGGGPRYEVQAYADLAREAERGAERWDLIVCNFSLLGADVAPVLQSLARRLAANGRVLVQTVHPWTVAASSPPYADGWRTETFAGISGSFPAPMPWYFRTMGSWWEVLRVAGLTVTRVDEPFGEQGGMPLSLLLECRVA